MNKMPELNTLSPREFGERVFLLFHHVDEANEASNQAALARGKAYGVKVWNPPPELQAKYDAQEREILKYERIYSQHKKAAQDALYSLGSVVVKITGAIRKGEQVYVPGPEGTIGGGRYETKTWDIELEKSKQQVWFDISDSKWFGMKVVGRLIYNGGEAAFNPKEVDIEYVS